MGHIFLAYLNATNLLILPKGGRPVCLCEALLLEYDALIFEYLAVHCAALP